MVDVTPGDSGANKGFWRQQLRDKYGKFVEMGGSVMFDVQLPGVSGTSVGIGKFIGMLDLETARIEVSDNSRVPKGVYFVKSKDITAIEAVLPQDYVEEKTEEAELKNEKPESNLAKSISGDEALKIRLKSVARALKSEGRFPIPRQGSFQEVGKDSDVSKGARIDYQQVFDSDLDIQERFKTFENMWDYVVKLGTDLTTQSPNDLNDIPEDMKALNRSYAKHILGLDPDGFITVYRNAVNGKDTEEESAVGYVSLDRQMAWDYNSTRENIGANGRYEIDVKPDEVYGMLGYSRVEDEYGLTIGRGVTYQEGRVRRVGDLEPARLAPWLEEWNSQFKRGQGSSPLRGFGVAGEYDLHEVEDFGETIQDFFAKYNLSAADISAMFDKLYGEGAYARYKESGNSVSYQLIKKMFVKLENGNLGLNVEYLTSFDRLKPNAEYKDDQFDNIMKMLSVFQELTGQYFMTHKTRNYTPPAPDNKRIDLGDTSWDAPPTEAQAKALEDYGSGELAIDANSYLRTGKSEFYPLDENSPESVRKGAEQHLEELKQRIDDLSSAFESSSLNKDMTVYRSLSDPSFGFDYDLELEEGEILDLSRLEGTIYTDKGFMSTTKNADFSYSASPIRLKINAKAGQKAIDLLGAIQFDSLQREQEVLFPAGSKFRISKAYYKNDENKYYLEMDYLDSEADLDVDEASSDDSSTIYDYFFDGGMIDLQALRKSGERVSPYDLEMFSDDQIKALEWYGQAGHRSINKMLRSGDPISEEDQKLIDSIDEAIEENGDVFSGGRIFRGDTPSKNSEYYKFLQDLVEGKTVNFPGYFSASNDAQLAFSEFGPGQGGSDDDASNPHLSSTFFWSIDVPEGGKAMAMPEGVGFGQGAESEVLLPRNTKLKIIGIKKVEQVDDEGQSTGEFNYFIHAEQLVP